MKWQINKIRILAVLVLVCYGSTATIAQIRISGTVVDAGSNTPIAAASVFISNTSTGAVTNNNGQFELLISSAGSYDIVFQSLGYTTQVKLLTIKASLANFEVKLQPVQNELQEVIVRTSDANGWSKYGDFFLEQFIGKHPAAAYCKLKNKEAVKFNFSKSKNTLTAFATEPLIIENDYLGYNIVYNLTLFEFNHSTQIFLYQGYPLFQEQTDVRSRKREKFLERRRQVYQGSIMHFMRCFYRNTLLESGFEVRKITTIETKSPSSIETNNGTKLVGKVPDYFQVKPTSNPFPNKMRFISTQLLPRDSFGIAVDSATVLLEYPDDLHVHFTERTPEMAYSQGLGIIRSSPSSPINFFGLVSEIKFPQKQGVLVYANGSFFNGKYLLTSGYWAWSEKLSTLLPLDYK